MTFKINPYHQLVWRSPNTLQLGFGSGRQVVEAITAGQERFIDALYYGVSEGQVPALAKQLDLPTAEANMLLQRLQPLLIEPAPNADEIALALAERVRAGLDNREDAQTVMQRRSEFAVHLSTLDATGLTMLLALAAAGVGTVTSKDFSPVTCEDIATNVYPRALLGQPRFSAAKLILDSSWPATRLVSLKHHANKRADRVDLSLLVSQQVSDPHVQAAWRSREIPVIEIRYEPNGVEVSPVLGPEGPCLTCRDHYAQDTDECHLTISSQLLNNELRFDDAGSRLVGCGLALESVLNFIDCSPASSGYRYLRTPSGQVEKVQWREHEKCGCRLTAATLLSAAG